MEREQTTLRLPVELKEELKRQAQENGIGMNAIMILALEKGLEARKSARGRTQIQ